MSDKHPISAEQRIHELAAGRDQLSAELRKLRERGMVPFVFGEHTVYGTSRAITALRLRLDDVDYR